MRVRALAVRIITQMRHDKRTLALMIMAPLMMLSLLYFVFNAMGSSVVIAVVNAPEAYISRLEDNDVYVLRYNEAEARQALESGEAVASVNITSGKAYIEIDGSKPLDVNKALMALEAAARTSGLQARNDLRSEVYYLYGYEDVPTFDIYGALLIGFIIFFFVFLVAGISFLQERNGGTLEKLLSMPIKRWEIVLGYVLGFGIITVLQAFVISWFCIYVLNMVMAGSFALILLIVLINAMAALTLGILASTAANNEFQMIQFIPVVVIPQVFFSGIFNLPYPWDLVEKTVPLYYVTDALTQVMIKGLGFSAIITDLAVMSGFAVFFIMINIRLLKRYRSI
ncbi:MAG TPA: ABC transporter permease [Syntrophomonadaceae bacterium]|nr:ABC transporter permease [Syntrophomonadaceae bacterium]HNX28028.1 ABC transporter permease [Syntrophomonadaceae bacterium]HPR93340.1 ABC transporter permease [Syntrophomonadaceae bacterium]